MAEASHRAARLSTRASSVLGTFTRSAWPCGHEACFHRGIATGSGNDRRAGSRCVALILAGGNGTRLGELTRHQCKPALTFAGHYRNIDFTLSNCVHSSVRHVAVLTQYKSHTLIKHLTRGWNHLSARLGEFIEVWPAQQRLGAAWYAGTADAVYQNLDLLRAHGRKYTLVLAGDHIYQMDYRALLAHHAASAAAVTVACVPVALEEAGNFGVLGADADRVRSFIEKPAPGALGTAADHVLASMGVYVFDTDYLAERLLRDARSADSSHDFGRDILPLAVHEGHVAAFAFTNEAGRPRYWRDVGTLDAYWRAHMELLTAEPALDLYDPRWPLLTCAEPLPPARLVSAGRRRASVSNSLLSGGVVVRGASVDCSVLGAGVTIEPDCVLEEAVVLPGARIAAGCRLRRVIVDADSCVAEGAVIGTEGPGPIALVTREPAEPGLRCVA
jgi:glucose-1-phosphate adenylyltransferase